MTVNFGLVLILIASVLLVFSGVTACEIPLQELPDITIQGLKISQIPLLENTPFNIEVYVSNNSLIDIEQDFDVLVQSTLVPKEKQIHSIQKLAAGETKSFYINGLTGKSGQYNLKVTADYKNKIKESNETNNNSNTTITIQKNASPVLPDFKIVQISTEEQTLYNTVPFTLLVSVQNDSEQDFNQNVTLEYWTAPKLLDCLFNKNYLNNGKKRSITIEGGFEAGETRIIEIPGIAIKDNSNKIIAQIDPKNKIKETKENNNKAELKITQQSAANLLPNLKVANTFELIDKNNNVFDLVVDIENSSENDVTNGFFVSAEIKNPKQKIILFVEPIAANSTVQVKFENILLNNSATTVSSIADTKNTVKEQNEKDNQRKLTVSPPKQD